MTNPYYNPTGAPAQGSAVTSAVVRTEFAAIQAGFDKMPVLVGNAYEILRVKGDEGGFEASGLILDASGRLLHGATSAFDISPAGTGQYPSIGSFSTTNNFPFVGGVFSNDASGCNWTSVKSRATSVGSHVIVQNADQIGGMLFRADDGVTFRNCAGIYAHVDGIPAVNQMPGRLIFSVAPSGGAATIAEKMRIASDGTVTLGGTSTAPALKVNAYTADNWVTISSGTNPTIGTSAGNLALAPATGIATISGSIQATAVGNSIGLQINGRSSDDSGYLTIWNNAASTEYARFIGTSPQVTVKAMVSGAIISLSTEGGEQVRISDTALAVRYLTLTGAAAGGNPTIGVSAGNLGISSAIAQVTSSGASIATFQSTAASVENTVHISSTQATSGASLKISNSGTNVQTSLRITGTGHFDIYTNQTADAVPTTGNIGFRVANAVGSRHVTVTPDNTNPTIGVTGGSLAVVSALVLSQTTLLATSVALTNGAGASAGTLTNAPAAGNPTKWIPISDNGTTRYIPAW